MADTSITIPHEDGHFEGTIKLQSPITITDLGGYWEGTERCQNKSFERRSSTLRKSIIEVQTNHGPHLEAMQERFPGVSTHELVRFLKARNYDEKKAIAMYEAHLNWRKKTFPMPNEEAIKELLATRKFYLLDDRDDAGRPVMFYCLRRFCEAPYDVEKERDALVYMVEHQAVPLFGPSFDTQKMTVLIDVSGIRSPPINFLQAVNTVMEANYPETLFRTVMFPVPFWLQKVIQGLTSFVADDTRQKFAYVNSLSALEDFAMLDLEKMGPDIADLIKSKQLKK